MSPRKKNPYSSSVQKALGLYSLLVTTGRSYSLGRLAMLLDCSKQTVLRLIEEVQMAHDMTFESWIEQRERWFRAHPTSQRQDRSGFAESLGQLLLFRDLVWHLLPESLRNEITRNQEPLRSETLQTDKPRLTVSHPAGYIDYGPHSGKIETLITAVQEQKACDVVYRAPARKKAKQYRIAPFQLIAHNDALYVRAYLIPKAGHRAYDDSLLFAVHRFIRVKLLDTHHVHRHDPKQDAGYGLVHDNPTRIEVLFSPSLADYVCERRWSEDQDIRRHRDGSLTLGLTVGNAVEAVAWVLGFSGEATLVKPAWLAAQVREKAQAILGQHTAHT